MQVQRAIYKSYASLASAIQQNLKDRFLKGFTKGGNQGAQTYGELQQFLDSMFEKDMFTTMKRQSMFKNNGGHLPARLAHLKAHDQTNTNSQGKESYSHGDGITVWEQGNLIEVSLAERELQSNNTRTQHLWTVVRVLQHTTPDHKQVQKKQQREGNADDQLNLSSEYSLSAESYEGEER